MTRKAIAITINDVPVCGSVCEDCADIEINTSDLWLSYSRYFRRENFGATALPEFAEWRVNGELIDYNHSFFLCVTSYLHC